MKNGIRSGNESELIRARRANRRFGLVKDSPKTVTIEKGGVGGDPKIVF